MASAEAVLTDAKDITSRLAQHAARLDSAIRATVDDADETASPVRRAVTARVTRVIGVMHGVRTACDIFFERKNNNERA